MNTREQDLVLTVRGYAAFSAGGVVSRSIKDFKGETLLVGGGKAGGLSATSLAGHNLGVTNTDRLLKEIEQLKNGTFSAKYGGRAGLPLNSEDNKKKEISAIQEEVNQVVDKYYTVNIEPETDPDLLAFIANIEDMTSIPDGRFSSVIFENVNMNVWLDPRLFVVLERITKPGGIITIDGATHPRLLVVAFSHTKWASEVNAQLMSNVKLWPRFDRLAIAFKN